MVKKTAKTRTTAPKKTAATRRPAKTARKPTSTSKASAKREVSNSITINKKALKDLIARGSKQGYLTYDEINAVIPEDMLSTEQIEETLMLFDDHDIEIVDEKSLKKSIQAKKRKEAKLKERQRAVADFGSVTDPV